LVPAEPEGCPEFEFVFGKSEILRKTAKSDDSWIPDDPHVAVRQIWHLRMGKEKTKDMEIPGKSQMADSYRRLLENPNFTGNSPNWKLHHGEK